MGMKDFEKEMRKTKEEWVEKRKGMEMVKVEWKREETMGSTKDR